MPLGAAISQGSGGENLVHIGAVRFRIAGVGNLNMTLYTLQEEKSVTNPNPLVMSTLTRIEPSKLFNMTSQRMKLRIQTTVINEFFRVNRIVVFAKPVFTDYPR